MRILVVDDEDLFRQPLVHLLESFEGYKVIECESGERAIDILKQEQFDVIVLDYKMREVSGLNVLQWMHEQRNETPVLMLTAAGSEFVAVEAMKLGAYDYLTKESHNIDHVPIILNGIHERYLFKKEKEHREQIAQERATLMASVKAFYDSVSVFSLIMNNTLSVMSLSLDEYKEDLLRDASPAANLRIAKAFLDLRQQHTMVTSYIKSVFNLAEGLYERFNITSKEPEGIKSGPVEKPVNPEVNKMNEKKK